MAEFPNRPEVTADMARVLARLGTRHRRELLAILGDPPDPNRVPASFWEKVKRETDDELLAALLVAVMISITQHGLPEDLAENLGTIWADARAQQSAAQITGTSQRWLRSGVAQIQQRAAGGTAAEGAEATTISDVVDRIFGPERAAAIARNETNVAMVNGGEIAIENLGIEVTKWWRHTQDPPPGQAGAEVDPCPQCTPYLDTEEADWDGEIPGEIHDGCLCYIEYREIHGGRRIGEDDEDGGDAPLPVATKSILPELRQQVARILKTRAKRAAG